MKDCIGPLVLARLAVIPLEYCNCTDTPGFKKNWLPCGPPAALDAYENRGAAEGQHRSQ